MTTTATNPYSRPVKLAMSANGAMRLYGAGAGRKRCPDGYLPVFSVDTKDEAEELITALCHLSRHDNVTYFMPFSGEFEHIKEVTTMIGQVVELRKRDDLPPGAWAEPFEAYKVRTGVPSLAALMA